MHNQYVAKCKGTKALPEFSSFPLFESLTYTTHAGNIEYLQANRELNDRLEDIWSGSALKPLCAPGQQEHSRALCNEQTEDLRLNSSAIELRYTRTAYKRMMKM